MIIATLMQSQIYTPIAIASYIIGIIAVAAVAVAVIKSKTITNTVTVLKENNQALADRVEILEKIVNDYNKKHADNLKKIEYLENQVNNLKTIPLEKISKHMENTNKSLSSIAKLLDKENKK